MWAQLHGPAPSALPVGTSPILPTLSCPPAQCGHRWLRSLDTDDRGPWFLIPFRGSRLQLGTSANGVM